MKVTELYPQGSKILIIGSYPPPLGGVSVHIYRLEKLLQQKGCNPVIFDLSKKSFPGTKIFRLWFLLLLQKWDVVHVHTGFIIILNIVRITKSLKKFNLFFTDHNPRLFHGKKDTQINKIRKFILKTDVVILVTDQIRHNYLSAGIRLPDRHYVKEAFLPPPLFKKASIEKSYPENLYRFLSNHSPLLFANAYQLNFFKNEDIYGLDMCITLTRRLLPDFPNIGFLFAIANENYNKSYFLRILDLIQEYNIDSHVYFLTGQYEIWPLYEKVTLFIRPTNTDGDAISIREALFFQIPVVASDTCPRPDGCRIFRTRDMDDLYKKTYSILKENLFI